MVFILFIYPRKGFVDDDVYKVLVRSLPGSGVMPIITASYIETACSVVYVTFFGE